MLPRQNVLLINGFAVVVVAEQPVMVPSSMSERKRLTGRDEKRKSHVTALSHLFNPFSKRSKISFPAGDPALCRKIGQFLQHPLREVQRQAVVSKVYHR